MKLSIKDHPFYIRMQQRSPKDIVHDFLGEQQIEHVDKEIRKDAFRKLAKDIMFGRAERTKYGFNSDTNGEIARALEWAFQAGIKHGKSCR